MRGFGRATIKGLAPSVAQQASAASAVIIYFPPRPAMLREPLLPSAGARTKGPAAAPSTADASSRGGGASDDRDARGGQAARARSPAALWPQVAVLTMSGLLLGYDLCLIASVLTPVQRDLVLCPRCAADGSDESLARCSCFAKQLAVSACHIGAMLGALGGGALADALGRRATLVLTDGGFVLGAAAMAAAAPGAWRSGLFHIGRLLSGVALGAAVRAHAAAAPPPPPRRSSRRSPRRPDPQPATRPAVCPRPRAPSPLASRATC